MGAPKEHQTVLARMSPCKRVFVGSRLTGGNRGHGGHGDFHRSKRRERRLRCLAEAQCGTTWTIKCLPRSYETRPRCEIIAPAGQNPSFPSFACLLYTSPSPR